MQKSTEAKSETVETRWRKHAEARSDTAGRWNNVLVIPYGEDSFAEVEDQISKMFIIEFGEFGTFITKDAHWTPPLALPDATDPMYEGYTNAQLKVAGDEAVKERAKLVAKLKEYRGRAFGLLISKLSRDGEEAVRAHGDYGAAETAMDPLLLWRVIKDTHSHRFDDRTKAESQYEAFRRYSAVAQVAGESIFEYQRRFELIAGNLMRMGCMFEPTEEDKARHFISTLGGAYDELRRDIANDERKKIAGAMPKTVAAAVARAREFIPGGARGGRSMSGGVPAPVAYVARAIKKTDTRVCYNCEEQGHIAKYCKKAKKEKKGPHGMHMFVDDLPDDLFGY